MNPLEGRFKVGIKKILMAVFAVREQRLREQQLKLCLKCLLLEYIIIVCTSLNNMQQHLDTQGEVAVFG